MIYLTEHTIEIINQNILNDTNEKTIVQYPAGLSIVVNQPQLIIYGKPAYPGIFIKAAYILQKITKKHIFQDGNKRTALSSMVYFLALNGYTFKMPDYKMINFMVTITKAPDSKSIMNIIAYTIKKYSEKTQRRI